MKDAAAIYDPYDAEIGATKLTQVRTPYLPENVRDFAPKGSEQAGEQSATCSSHLCFQKQHTHKLLILCVLYFSNVPSLSPENPRAILGTFQCL